MSTSPFAAPAPASGGIDLDSVLGALLLVTVNGQEIGVNTVHGSADPIRADVAVLDGEHKGETHPDVLLFPRVLISQLKPRIGQKVLGRLGKGTAKAGQSAPWVLEEATEADVAVGTAYLAQGFAAPAASHAAPF